MRGILIEIVKDRFKLAWENCKPKIIQSKKQQEFYQQNSVFGHPYYKPQFKIGDIIINVLVIEKKESVRILSIKLDDVLKNFKISHEFFQRKLPQKYFSLNPLYE